MSLESQTLARILFGCLQKKAFSVISFVFGGMLGKNTLLLPFTFTTPTCKIILLVILRKRPGRNCKLHIEFLKRRNKAISSWFGIAIIIFVFWMVGVHISIKLFQPYFFNTLSADRLQNDGWTLALQINEVYTTSSPISNATESIQ